MVGKSKNGFVLMGLW